MATTTKTRQGKVLPSKANVSAASKPANKSTENPLINNAKLQQLYSTMLRCRMLTDRRSGPGRRADAGAQIRGEAVVVGSAIDLRADDWVSSSRTDVSTALLRDVPLSSLLSVPAKRKAAQRSWTERPRADVMRTAALHLLAEDDDDAARLQRASGLALASKANGAGNVVMAFFDAMPKFDDRWRDALTFAGEQCLPLLLVIRGAAARRAKAAGGGTTFANLLSEGRACEVPVIPVDADDVIAIYRVVYESIHKARHGGGPTLVQAMTLPAPAKSVRAQSTVRQQDAIARMESYLESKQLFSEVWKGTLIRKFDRELNHAMKASKSRARRKDA